MVRDIKAFKVVTDKVGTEPIPSSSATPSAHDRELGEYVLRNTLARGGSGIVSVANHSRTGIPVAVKEILRTRHNHPRVDLEIEIFRSLKHVSHTCPMCIALY